MGRRLAPLVRAAAASMRHHRPGAAAAAAAQCLLGRRALADPAIVPLSPLLGGSNSARRAMTSGGGGVSSSSGATPDPFGRQAEAYAVYRPDYPELLIEQVLARLKAKGLIPPPASEPRQPRLLVDVCTGSGQVLRKLAGHFPEARGFDRSVAQLSQATQLPNVTYAEADACALPVAAAAAAVVTCAQAMHWLDIPRFMREVDRVLCTGGVAIVLGYPRTRIPGLPEADAALLRWYDGLEGYWDARCDRHLLDAEFDGAQYAPLVEVGKDRVEQEEVMTPARLGAYLRTWSAYNEWRRRRPDARPDTVDVLESELSAALATAGRETLLVRFVFFAIYLQRPADVDGGK